MVNIKSLTFKNDEIKLTDLKKPEPNNNEVLIEVSLAGICNTDLEIMSGMLGFTGIPGHEFVGKVVDDPRNKLSGKRVVGEVNIPCYNCERCRRRQFRHCLNIKALGMRGRDGAFAEYLTLPRENIHLVPETVSDREAVFVEPIAAAVEIAEQYHLKPSEEIAILGDGKLGLIIARTLKALGYSVLVIGRHESKLARLKSLKIPGYLERNLPKNIQDIPVVVEVTGSSSGLERALQLVRPEGKVIFKTTIARKIEVNLSILAIDEIQLLGSRCGPFPPALNLLKDNNFYLEELITDCYPLEKGPEALEKARDKVNLKVLLQP